MKTKKEEDKKKTISFSIDPRVYEMWVKYCEDNGIENYSSYIEKVIIEKTKDITKIQYLCNVMNTKKRLKNLESCK